MSHFGTRRRRVTYRGTVRTSAQYECPARVSSDSSNHSYNESPTQFHDIRPLVDFLYRSYLVRPDTHDAKRHSTSQQAATGSRGRYPESVPSEIPGRGCPRDCSLSSSPSGQLSLGR